jgi:hypothetical protein
MEINAENSSAAALQALVMNNLGDDAERLVADEIAQIDAESHANSASTIARINPLGS